MSRRTTRHAITWRSFRRVAICLLVIFVLLNVYLWTSLGNSNIDNIVILYHGNAFTRDISKHVERQIQEFQHTNAHVRLFVTNEHQSFSSFDKRVMEAVTVLGATKGYQKTFLWVHYTHDPSLNTNIIDIAETLKEHVTQVTTSIHYDKTGALSPHPSSYSAYRRLYAISNHVILLSEIALETFSTSLSVSPNKLVAIPYHVDQASRVVRVEQPTMNIVSYVCTNRYYDNILQIVKNLISYSRVDMTKIKTTIVVCKESPQLIQELSDKARKLGIGTLVKVVPESQPSLIDTASIYVHHPLTTDLYDPLLVSAMTQAVPIVTIDHGYAQELYYQNDMEEYLAAKDQIKSVIKKLIELINMDSTKRKEYGERLAKIIQNQNSLSQTASVVRSTEPGTQTRQLMCNLNYPYSLPRSREGYINYGSIETFDGSKTHVSEAKIGTYNILSDPTLQINIHTDGKYVDSVGMMYYEENVMHQFFMNSISRKMTWNYKLKPTTVEHDNGESSTMTFDIGYKYSVQLTMHKHNDQSTSWIDIMIWIHSELALPVGVIGHSARNVHLNRNIDEPLPFDKNVWNDHYVEDSIFGTKFKNNIFVKDVLHSDIFMRDTRTCLPKPEDWSDIEANTPVWYHGPQMIYTGMATVNRELSLRIIQDTRIDLKITTRDGKKTISPSDDPRFAKLVERFVRAEDVNPSSIAIQSGWPPILAPIVPGGKWIMTQPWEFGIIPKQWAENATSALGPSQIWAPSRYVRKTYTKAGVPQKNIVIVPHGIISNRFSRKPKDDMFPTAKKFVFMYRGGMLARKGADLLLKAFLETFSEKDPVTLLIHGNYEDFHKTAIERAINFPEKNAPHVIFTKEIYSTEDSIRMYHNADCFVAPYRSEGFGLPILEAMAAKLPVIVTAYGPALDFCNNDNSYLVKAQEVDCRDWPCADTSVFHHRTDDKPTWSKPDVEELKRIMRHVYENQKEAKKKAVIAKRWVESFWTWERASKILVTQLHKVILSK